MYLQLFTYKDNSMNKKLELGLVSLNEIKLRMKYDLGKTLTENLMLEQPESVMDRRVGITNKNMDSLGLNPKSASDIKKYESSVSPTLSNLDWNTHDWLSFVEIATGILGVIPSPASIYLLGISVSAGVADGLLYLQEGDKYMGTMMLALSIIPGGELKAVFKNSKVFITRGVEGCGKLIKKYKSGSKLTKTEVKDLTKLSEEFVGNASILNKLMTKNLSNKILQTLSKQSPKFLINLILILKRLGIIKLSEISLKIGGLVYGLDKLYLYVFRDNQKDLDQRTRNEIRASINGLLGYEKEVKEYLMITAKDGLEKLIKSGKSVTIPEPKETRDKFFEEAIKRESEKIQKVNIKPSSPSLQSVLTNNSIIKMGQSGESVKKIQKMLYEIGYDHLLTAFETLSNWNDGIFGENTKDAIITFQEDNSLVDDGIVGKKTLTKLMNIYKEQNNKK